MTSTPIRNDRAPVVKRGYEATGDGRYAECPDHGSRLWFDGKGSFVCPAMARGESLHKGEPYAIDHRDVYLEHNEAWRVVNGCLYVDEYDETDETDESDSFTQLFTL